MVDRMKSQCNRRRFAGSKGFTLIELLLAFAIVATITAMAIPSFMGAVRNAKTARAIGDIRSIGNDIMANGLQTGRFIDDLAELGYADNKDPWGNQYQYLNHKTGMGNGTLRKDRFNISINAYFDLYSLGPDLSTAAQVNAGPSQYDTIWAGDGNYIGLASQF